MINELANYDSVEERKDLLEFCKHLSFLIEATFIISQWAAINEKSGLDINNYDGFLTSLLKQHTFEIEDIENSEKIIKETFETFTIDYAKAELWDMLDSAISYKGDELEKTKLLYEYECLYTVLEGAWQLYKNDKKEL